MTIKKLDDEASAILARLFEADTDNFNALVQIAGLDPARDFRFADLSGTNMTDCDLRSFDFCNAVFRDVIVQGARIAGTNFSGADIEGTDLSSAEDHEDVTSLEARAKNASANGHYLEAASLYAAAANFTNLETELRWRLRLAQADGGFLLQAQRC
jgi:uncharacterized protein YjbI with pentapeptide repeats